LFFHTFPFLYTMTSNSLLYSDLEVVPCEIRVSDPGKQVTVEAGKIVAVQHYGLELTEVNGDILGSTQKAELMSNEQVPLERKKWSVAALSKRQRWWIIGGVMMVILLIILAVVHHSVAHASSSSASYPLTSSTSTSSPVSENTSTAAPALATASPTTSSTAVVIPTATPIRNIAAISYTSNSVNTTRLYYQDNSGQLIEAMTSNSSSSTTSTWTTNKLNHTANNGSAIAAAVTKPGLEPMVKKYSFVYLS
jgi:hypothetical protein